MAEQNLAPELKPLLLPSAPSDWPPAIGWWVLALAVIGLLLCLGIWLLRRHRSMQWYRQAKQMLSDLSARDISQSAQARQVLSELSVWTRKVALATHPREDISALHGQAWQQWLAQKSQQSGFLSTQGKLLTEAQFMPDQLIESTQIKALLNDCKALLEQLKQGKKRGEHV